MSQRGNAAGYRNALLAIAAAAGLVWAAGCGDGVTEPPAPSPDPPRPTTVTVSPSTAELAAVGETVQLAASVLDQNGNAMTGETVTWSSSAAEVATVSGTGLATSTGNGEATITALAGTASGTAAVRVQQLPARTEVAPDSLMLEPADTARLTATVTDANGHVVEGAGIEWASADVAVATVDSLGLVTAVAKGGAAVSARSGTTSDTASVTVRRTPAEIAVAPDSVAFAALGDTARLSATVLDRRGEVIEDAEVMWSSRAAMVAAVDPLGLVTSVGNGSATITASAGGGVEAAATVAVDQIPASVAIEPESVVFYDIGETAILAAAVRDANGHAIDDAGVSWASDDRSVVTVTPAGAVTAAGYGTALVRASSGAVDASAEASVLRPSPERDRQVLIDLYESAGGDGWLESDGWTTGAPLSSWHGVETDAEGYVTHLWLVYNGLTGRLPPSLGRLRRLEELVLYENRIGGSIPPELGQLQRLERLWMSGNAFEGPIPPELGRLAALEELGLQYNSLSGSIPPELGNLSSLKDMRLYGNSFSGSIPPELGNLRNLKRLELNGRYPYEPNTGLSGEIPPELGNLASLEEIRLDRNQLSGEIPAELGNLDNLVRLSLFENELTGPIPPELGRLRNLEALWLGWNRFSGPIPPELAGMTSLVIMNFGGLNDGGEELEWEDVPRLSGPIPPELAGMPNLRDFVAFYHDLAGPIPAEFGKTATLEWIELADTKMEGLVPRSLMNLGLQYFTIDGTGICPQRDAVFQEWWNGIGTVHPNEDCTDGVIERMALSETYDGTGGASWTEDAGWNTDEPVGDWYGVTTVNGRVAELRLPDNGLRGPLPAEVANFTGLKVLDVGGNELAGSLPEEIATLHRLIELRVGGNARLEGVLPYDLTRLRDLGVLRHDGTGLCASPAPSFQEWYRGIGDRAGVVCGNAEQVKLSVPVVYLTQAIQTPERGVRLVEGRDALLRVFVTGNQERAFFEPRVVATIEGGGRTHTVEMTRHGDRIATAADESDLANSYNAVVPGALIARGATLAVHADPDGVVPLAPGSATRFPASGSEPLDVVTVPPMELTVVPVLEAVQPDSSIFEWTDNIGDGSEEVGLFKYSFPFGDFRARSRETYVTSLDLTSDAGQWGLVLELEAVRAAEGGTGYWYGAAASVNGYVRGVAYLAGWVGMGKAWDTELAHEVGHNLNLRHAPCGGAGAADPDFPHDGGSIGAWGFDFRDSTLVSPRSRKDIMGYCYEQGWLSDFYFEKVIDYREEVEGDGARALAAGRSEGDALVLWGGVVNGEIQLLTPFKMQAPPKLPDRPGPYRIEATGVGGRTEIDLSFTPGEDQFGNKYFFFTIPVEAGWADSLDRLTLTGPEGIVTVAAADERTVTIFADPATGRIRGILRDWDGTPPAALGPVDAFDATTTRGLAGSVRQPR